MLQRGAPKTEAKVGQDGKPLKDKRGNVLTEVVRDKRGRIVYEPYEIKVINTIDFKKSMHYNPFAYIRSENDILKFVTALIANTKGDGKSTSLLGEGRNPLILRTDRLYPLRGGRAREEHERLGRDDQFNGSSRGRRDLQKCCRSSV